VPLTDDKRPAVEVFYCCSCPWTYLAFGRVQETAQRTGARITWRPVLVDWVHHVANRAFPGSRTDPNPRKAAYQAKDLQDWARFCGVPIRQPQPSPITPEHAQRGAIVAARRGALVPYATAVFRAYFAESRNIAELPVVMDVAAGAGLGDEAFAAELASAETLARLRQNCDELVARGGFGSPTMFVGNDMYFGNDRMPLVELALGLAGGHRMIAPGAHSQQ
jgi:2-hydroxychromene-2-carboxylate isomerase